MCCTHATVESSSTCWGEKRLKPYARVKAVKEACEHCLAERWQQLVTLQMQRKAKIITDDPSPAVPGLIDEKNAKTILKAATLGNTIGCWRRVCSYGVAPCNHQVADQLCHKWGCNRKEPLLLGSVFMSEPMVATMLDSIVLGKVMQKLAPGKAQDVFGWTRKPSEPPSHILTRELQCFPFSSAALQERSYR